MHRASRPTSRSSRWDAAKRGALTLTASLTLAAIPTSVAAGQDSTPAATGAAVTAEGCWTAEQRLPETDATGAEYTAAPATIIDPARGYQATVETSRGTVEIELLPAEAPLAVNNFVCLAADGYYDGTPFHRIVAGFVVQGGDSTGTGSGGPGYEFADEPVVRDYEPGTVAMANAGPNTNGSQFFFVLDDLSAQLPKNYTIFGRVVSGQAVVDEIAAIETTAGPSGEQSQPTETVTIDQVTIQESAPVAAATPAPAAEGSLGELADRLTSAWSGIDSYRGTTTFSTAADGTGDAAASPVAGAEGAEGAEVIVDEVVLPDRRRTSRSGAGIGFEAIVIGDQLFVRGALAATLGDPSVDPTAWIEIDPATIDPANPANGIVASLLGPITPPWPISHPASAICRRHHSGPRRATESPARRTSFRCPEPAATAPRPS